MNQEELKKKIHKSAEDIPIPESLSPEQIGRKLGTTKRKMVFSPAWKWGTAAAVCVVALSVFINYRPALPQVMQPLYDSPGAAEVVLPEGRGFDSVNPGNGGSGNEGSERKTGKKQEYADVYNAISPYIINIEQLLEYEESGLGVKEDVSAAPEAKLSGAMTGSEARDISGTNVQVVGVDEGDVVKTDGSCIYTLADGDNSIRLIRVDGTELKLLSAIAADQAVKEFYIYGDRLSLIYETYQYEDGTKGPDKCGGWGMIRNPRTTAETYDISDREHPALLGSVVQDGAYTDSRMKDRYLYLFTSYWPEYSVKQEETERYIPKVNDKLIPADRILIPDAVSDSMMLTISAIDISNPGQPVDTTAALSGANVFYVSNDNIYVGSNTYDFAAHQYNYTELLKFAYDEGKITYKTKSNIDGRLNNQFSLDEYDGYLRVVSTLDYQNGVETNSLSVFDKDLNLVGLIEDLAPGEQIYSARFMGAMAYFVTYRNMDPLFAADLSNPLRPKILGELKITGFSQYLHPYSDNLLLGIGQETDPVTGNFKGLKLSMFDITDPVQVKERNKMVQSSMEYSPAWYNHKAVLISPSKNLIGFAARTYGGRTREWESGYVIYGYQPETGFVERLNHKVDQESIDNVRGLYIDNFIYIVESNKITVYSLQDFSLKTELKY